MIRADASVSAGAGHVMRSLALAQAWQEAGGRPVFGMSSGAEFFGARLRGEGIPVEPIAAEPGGASDVAATSALARRIGARWIVADGYWASSDFQHGVCGEGARLAVVDDTGALAPYAADLIVNPNLHAHPGLYARRRPESVLLLGTRFSLLRRELARRPRPEREFPPEARRLLVTLGGSDPVRATERVVRSLGRLSKDIELRVLVGPANPGAAAIEAAAARFPGPVQVLGSVEDVAELYDWADLAVTGGGSTCWELAFRGTPFVTVVIAENQSAIARSLASAGASVDGGWHGSLRDAEFAALVASIAADPEARRQMSAAGQGLVDGRGADRVVERFS